MEPLDPAYVKQIDQIAEAIQKSEALAHYLDDEEEASYKQMVDEFEPQIEQVYQAVADEAPMQLLDLEERLMDERLEALYMPRILGFSILRGIVNENYKFINPQESFRKALLYICTSPNFEIVKNRIGQGIQVGFALSSDIWISNLIQEVPLKTTRHYLQSQKLQKYRDVNQRKIGYHRYKQQFSDHNFYTASFPTNDTELKLFYPSVKNFFVERVLRGKDNRSLHPYISDFVANDSFSCSLEYVYLFGLFINYCDVSDSDAQTLAKRLNHVRIDIPEFNDTYFIFLRELLDSRLPVTPACDKRVYSLLDMSISDDLQMYYSLTDVIHSKGYVHSETQEAVRQFYYAHEGLSTINECLRLTILKYFFTLLDNLSVEEYKDFMEIYNVFIAYMTIFQNEKFDQSVKHASLSYVKKLTKHYTDKRGKDYQAIKKFIMSTFQELGFMTEKELKNFFKTKRKRKKSNV